MRRVRQRVEELHRRIEHVSLRARWAIRRAQREQTLAVPQVGWRNVEWKKAAMLCGSGIVLIAACISLASQLFESGRDPLGHVHRLIDVRTGEVYEWNTRDTGAIVLPARDPSTGTIALVPITELEPGRWGVTERDMQLLHCLDHGVQVRAVDPTTGVVTSAAGGVKRYTKFNQP